MAKLGDNIERERRFLVDEPSFLEGASSTHIRQAYVFSEGGYAIRVRVEEAEDEGAARATLTAKGPRVNDERKEFDFTIDANYANEVIKRSTMIISKRRFSFTDRGQVWDVDVFEEENQGLVIAELEGEDIRHVPAPWWALREITGETRFNNDELVKKPVSKWHGNTWRSQSIWDDEV